VWRKERQRVEWLWCRATLVFYTRQVPSRCPAQHSRTRIVARMIVILNKRCSTFGRSISPPFSVTLASCSSSSSSSSASSQSSRFRSLLLSRNLFIYLVRVLHLPSHPLSLSLSLSLSLLPCPRARLPSPTTTLPSSASSTTFLRPLSSSAVHLLERH
jgi:hypothetical protein